MRKRGKNGTAYVLRGTQRTLSKRTTYRFKSVHRTLSVTPYVFQYAFEVPFIAAHVVYIVHMLQKWYACTKNDTTLQTVRCNTCFGFSCENAGKTVRRTFHVVRSVRFQNERRTVSKAYAVRFLVRRRLFSTHLMYRLSPNT